MSKPLVITIPHQLGRDAAVARLKTRLHTAHEKFGQFFAFQQETWVENRLHFRLAVLAQSVSGTIEVLDDHVRLELVLPWLLAKIAGIVEPMIRKEGTLLLEKK
jgi:hypothetical protein